MKPFNISGKHDPSERRHTSKEHHPVVIPFTVNVHGEPSGASNLSSIENPRGIPRPGRAGTRNDNVKKNFGEHINPQ
jgi:hypothetical protein